VFDNFSTGHRWAVKWGQLVFGDLGDLGVIRRTLAEHKIAAVVHFAASAYVGESMSNPRKYFRNNLVNTINLLDALVEMKVPHLVFSSTCATYGVPKGVPIAETHAQCPVNPYGESKLAIEKALEWYAKAYRLRWTALRYFNAAGADVDGETGEAHDPECHLIPSAIEAALGQRSHVEVFGTDYPTPDGTAIRDYVHVTDLAAAHVLSLRYLRAGGESVALNLGTGRGHSVQEIITAVETAAGLPVPTRRVDRRTGDPPALVADARKAASLLGWRPKWSGLGSIVQTAFRWQATLSHTVALSKSRDANLAERRQIEAA
jgi:UDP-glucose-4-epimerase GalE